MSSNIAQQVETIWRDVLTVPDGQEGATFFELGGESISAVRLVSRIEEELDVWLDVGDIFEDDPNLATLVATVVTKAEEASAA
ncbi:phosphopantetheine-binding protein [Actinophytocola oryzae]|uniref:Phosphopantetheine binding protein n=1 Tax=Actinophytocola oryzae TaxID=502181 RepID=A0A4V3FQV4_9PSEU|nr:phosphopantetheine-binding protein [Actinophytocola oryzae]TDV41061.1 phosphopantetheine binding protein [Actinophytocola oryzae]